ncbi:MAG: TIGR00282 family metallophosphoesterase, partial [Nitrospirota bacterium]
GDPGRKAVASFLPKVRERYGLHVVVANGENAAGGFGITPKIAEELLGMDIDLLTSGNHIWDKKEIYDYIDRTDRLIRPANLPPGVPGTGSAVFTASEGTKVGVINLMGRIFLTPSDCPFRRAKEEIEKLKGRGAEVILIDFHAEATSEKIALARHLDGQVAAVVGTHTHVQTSDEKILSGGTAFITDVGMTGPHDSVIGVTSELAIGRFLTQMPARFDTAKGPGTFEAVIISADPMTGKATKIQRLSLIE